MQKFDGKDDGKFDGRPPDSYKAASWKGVLLTLLMIGVFLGLLTWAFLSVIAQPGGPDLRIPMTLPG
jgi:hypothetical protein